MTSDEKSLLTAMRKAGRSYIEIADELCISKNTIKTFCRRNGLAPEAEDMPEETTTVPATDRLCPKDRAFLLKNRYKPPCPKCRGF